MFSPEITNKHVYKTIHTTALVKGVWFIGAPIRIYLFNVSIQTFLASLKLIWLTALTFT